MRAARLIRLVLLLQTRRTMTGAELATELEVSERTVSRDVLALSEAGIPVYAERGRAGGYRLVGGYRTRLTGLGRSEAEALFLSGVPSALRDMGLADAATAARLKVSAALMPELSDAQDSAAQRFHLDAPGWWQPPATPPLLPVVAEAVWDDLRLAVRYRRRDGKEVKRTLDPYGLVLKAGIWYLVALAGEDHRVYRVDRLTAAEAPGPRFERDEAFRLPGFWAERAAEFASSILRERVTLRLSPPGARRLRYATDRMAADAALADASEPDDSGWITVSLPVESLDVAYEQLMALGPEAEVREPAALRQRLRQAAGRMRARYELTEDAPDGDAPGH